MPSGAPPAPVVVTLLGEIDVTNAGDVEARITAALAAGAGVVIADLTAMTFCDSEGLQHLLRAREKAAGAGAQLRLAITPDTTVARIMELAGINATSRSIPRSSGPPTAVCPASGLPPRAGRHRRHNLYQPQAMRLHDRPPRRRVHAVPRRRNPGSQDSSLTGSPAGILRFAALVTGPARASLCSTGRGDHEAVYGLGALAGARGRLAVTLTALPARSVAARAPGAASSLRARCAATAAHSARLRLETAATGHDIAWTLDMLAVTLDSIAARHPDRADRLAARSESARALAARIRQQFPVSRHAAVPAGRSRPPAPQPDAVPASPARRVTPRPGLAVPRGAAPDLAAPVPG